MGIEKFMTMISNALDRIFGRESTGTGNRNVPASQPTKESHRPKTMSRSGSGNGQSIAIRHPDLPEIRTVQELQDAIVPHLFDYERANDMSIYSYTH